MTNTTKIATEEALIAGLQRREKQAFEDLYDKYSAALYGVVFRVLQKEDAAQDVLQEAFVKAWKNIHRYDASKGRLFTWLLNIARNAAIDKRRSAGFRHERTVREQLDFISESLAISEEMPVDGIGVREVVEQLKPELRDVIHICYFLGYSHSEAAKELGLPLGTVKSRIRQAMKELRRVLT